jgi:hypothetical protein
MTPEQVFTIRFGQLVALTAGAHPDQLIDLPVVLRQLLVDGSPLVHQVNRSHRLKLRFTIGLSARERSKEMCSLGLPIPDVHLLAILPPNEPKREVDLAQLLAHEVVKIGANYYSAHDLLDACANRMGGVHFDPKGTDHEVVRDVSALGRFLEQVGLGSAFGVLLLLARIAHHGLLPLYEAVRGAEQAPQ